MNRIKIQPRENWQKTIESQGYLYHESQGVQMWNESAFYELNDFDVESLEAATAELIKMCNAAAEHVVSTGHLERLGIPASAHQLVVESWKRKDPSLYGRFDLAYDGVNPPKMLEFNADTPTALLEAAVIQWFWFQERFPKFDQFNSVHERLVGAWRAIGAMRSNRVHFAAVEEALEDFMTVAYLRDTAEQAGLATEYIGIEEVGWNEGALEFRDLHERRIASLFKLYPWEWMLDEDFGKNISRGTTSWIEPPWKMLWSTKALLPILYELFPDSPYLLPASFSPPDGDYVVKPVHSREGANIRLVRAGRSELETPGPYTGPVIYQKLFNLPCIEGKYPIFGSWVVAGKECGVGIREDDTPITRNSSAFVPHVFVSSYPKGES